MGSDFLHKISSLFLLFAHKGNAAAARYGGAGLPRRPVRSNNAEPTTVSVLQPLLQQNLDFIAGRFMDCAPYLFFDRKFVRPVT
jgi:hypothetical protein